MSFKLSAILEGHTNDVRCVVSGSDSNIVSGSRDATARWWAPTNPDPDPESSGNWIQKQLFQGHPNYVTAVCWRDPDPEFPEGGLYTGCQDGKIRVFNLNSGNPVSVLEGHTSCVSKLFLSPNKTLLSTSWDSTARVWLKENTVMTLSGHQMAVWSGIIKANMMVTASADQTLKLWKAGKCINTLKVGNRH